MKPVYSGHCISRSPLYNSQVTESQMGLQCAFQPALTGHLSITASFLGPKGDHYRQVSLYYIFLVVPSCVLLQVALCYVELFVDGLYRKITQLSSKKTVDTCTSSRSVGLHHHYITGCDRGVFPFCQKCVCYSSSMPKCFRQCLLFVEQCSGMVGTTREESAVFQLRGLRRF